MYGNIKSLNIFFVGIDKGGSDSFPISNFQNMMFRPFRMSSYQVKPEVLMPSRPLRNAI